MSNPEIDRFVQEAYYQAEETLLWSETGGCNESCDLFEEIESFHAPVCDRSFDSHGWTTDDIEHAPYLHEAIHSMVTDYWIAIQWMEMSAEEFGHNFILTANGHGTGFWARDYEPVIMCAMTEDCKPYGEFRLEEYATTLQIV